MNGVNISAAKAGSMERGNILVKHNASTEVIVLFDKSKRALHYAAQH
jgi:hypothetical protein